MTKRIVLALLLLAATRSGRSEELSVIADGRSDYVIAISEQSADPAKISEAAELLQSCLARATGVRLPVVTESEAPEGQPALYLGKTEAAEAAGLPVDEVTGWGFLQRVVGANVFLVGEEDPAHELIPKRQAFSGYSGTYTAVTRFLEDQVGVRFLLPGEMGVYIPKRDGLAIDASLDVSWSPLFTFVGRRVSPYSGEHEYDSYAIANHYFGRYSSDSKTFWMGGSHTWNEFVPREKYLESHPEYFSLFKGKRDFHKRNILCLSQPAVLDLLVSGVVEKFDKGYEMVMLGQSDGYIECQCEDCQAIHPDIGEKLWITHRKVAERIGELRPGKKVVLSSYITTTKPPLTFDSFPDNVVIMNNRYSPAWFEAWEPFPTPRVVYIPDWLRNWPRVPPRYAVNLVRLWKENDVIVVYMGGGLDQAGSSWGLNGPSYYAFGKAMEDPSRDADELEREYVEASFGAAAEPMAAFFTAMHRRMEVRQRFDRHETGNPDRRYRGYPFEMYPGDYHAHFFPPQILEEMNRQLALASELVDTDEARARLELVEAEFRYLHSVASTFHVIRAYQVAPTRPLFDALADQVKNYHRTYDGLYPEGEARSPGGYRKLRTPFGIGWPTGKKPLEKVAGPPFDWDFANLRESDELPNPIIVPRIRGGQILKPYGGSDERVGQTDGGVRIDPRTGAPEDQ